MNEEDEAFEELALKQGQWHPTPWSMLKEPVLTLPSSPIVKNLHDKAIAEGWRKRQIERDFAAIDDANNIRKKQIAHMDVHSHPAEFVHLHRNDTIEEIAQHLETKFTGPFGRDTVQSFATFVRSMKK